MPGCPSYNKRGWPEKEVILTKPKLYVHFIAIYNIYILPEGKCSFYFIPDNVMIWKLINAFKYVKGIFYISILSCSNRIAIYKCIKPTCCIPQNYTMLYVNYIPIKINKVLLTLMYSLHVGLLRCYYLHNTEEIF